jgi:hypothetical protein
MCHSSRSSSLLADGSFQGYITVEIPPDGVNSWLSAVQTPFNGAPMPNEYAAVDSAADSIIQFHCTHKNVKVDDVNYSPRMQAEQFNGAMPNEYAAVDSAADSVIQFLCTHKNVKVR